MTILSIIPLLWFHKIGIVQQQKLPWILSMWETWHCSWEFLERTAHILELILWQFVDHCQSNFPFSRVVIIYFDWLIHDPHESWLPIELKQKLKLSILQEVYGECALQCRSKALHDSLSGFPDSGCYMPIQVMIAKSGNYFLKPLYSSGMLGVGNACFLILLNKISAFPLLYQVLQLERK